MIPYHSQIIFVKSVHLSNFYKMNLCYYLLCPHFPVVTLPHESLFMNCCVRDTLELKITYQGIKWAIERRIEEPKLVQADTRHIRYQEYRFGSLKLRKHSGDNGHILEVHVQSDCIPPTTTHPPKF